MKIANATQDQGFTYGYVIIRNWCEYVINYWSVGVWPVGGCKDNGTGFGTCEEMIMRTIRSNEFIVEPYRQTCFQKKQDAGFHWYCPEVDKAAGQGVSIKISKDNTMANIIQFEYALVMDTARGDNFYRLNYDVSMLDCASQNAAGVTDESAAAAESKGDTRLHDAKVKGCPGYEGGLAVTFDGNTTNCSPIFCDGTGMCERIYTFDRTRPDEASLACEAEYRGNMTLDLCVSKNPDRFTSASQQDQRWRGTATKIPGNWGKKPTGAPLPSGSLSGSNTAGAPPVTPLPSTAQASLTTPPANNPSTGASLSRRDDENGGSPPSIDLDAIDPYPSTLSTVAAANKKRDNAQPVSMVHVTRTTILTVRTHLAKLKARDGTQNVDGDGREAEHMARHQDIERRDSPSTATTMSHPDTFITRSSVMTALEHRQGPAITATFDPENPDDLTDICAFLRKFPKDYTGLPDQCSTITGVPSHLHQRQVLNPEVFTPTTYETVTTSILSVTYKDAVKGTQTGICVQGIFTGTCHDCSTGACDDFPAHGESPHLYRCQCPPFDSAPSLTGSLASTATGGCKLLETYDNMADCTPYCVGGSCAPDAVDSSKYICVNCHS
ncbi:hypothetical protein BDV96DRAFT_521108 [Lophiotrema nucula]|uniref:Uncharacterized protein n=1 Tax=Lophiotrema nucula TaxID=690887 RepID=A0A6A5Z814_9PLEO|nr:hypothetical protein BDV96DRAFT_521108 [Lophiotrema nucula]